MTLANPIPRRPLVLCDAADLLDALLSIASAAGVQVDNAVDAAAAGSLWRSAPLVVVVDHPDVHQQPIERRRNVLLVSWDLDDADVWRRAHLLGADHVVLLPDGRAWLADQLADAALDAGLGACVAVTGARGGAGASTLAVALAQHAANAARQTALIDGDAAGGGLDLVLGAEDAEGVRWPELSMLEGRIPGSTLVEALPRRRDLRFLSCTRDQELPVSALALDAVVSSLRRVRDVVVVDLPRTDASLLVSGLTHADLFLLVVPAEVRAVAAATRMLSVLPMGSTHTRIIVRLPGAGGLDEKAVEDAVGYPSIGTVRDDPRAATAIDRGEGPDHGRRGAWRSVCESVLEMVAAEPPAAA